MLSAGSRAPGSVAAYVAIDQVNGTLAGKAGAFMLLHRGTTIDTSDASELSDHRSGQWDARARSLDFTSGFQ